MPNEKMVKMLLQVTIFLLLFRAGFSSTLEEPYKLGKANHLKRIFNRFEYSATENENQFYKGTEIQNERDIEMYHNRIKRNAASTTDQSTPTSSMEPSLTSTNSNSGVAGPSTTTSSIQSSFSSTEESSSSTNQANPILPSSTSTSSIETTSSSANSSNGVADPSTTTPSVLSSSSSTQLPSSSPSESVTVTLVTVTITNPPSSTSTSFIETTSSLTNSNSGVADPSTTTTSIESIFSSTQVMSSTSQTDLVTVTTPILPSSTSTSSIETTSSLTNSNSGVTDPSTTTTSIQSFSSSTQLTPPSTSESVTVTVTNPILPSSTSTSSIETTSSSTNSNSGVTDPSTTSIESIFTSTQLTSSSTSQTDSVTVSNPILPSSTSTSSIKTTLSSSNSNSVVTDPSTTTSIESILNSSQVASSATSQKDTVTTTTPTTTPGTLISPTEPTLSSTNSNSGVNGTTPTTPSIQSSISSTQVTSSSTSQTDTVTIATPPLPPNSITSSIASTSSLTNSDISGTTTATSSIQSSSSITQPTTSSVNLKDADAVTTPLLPKTTSNSPTTKRYITFSPENEGYVRVKEDDDFDIDITCGGAFESLTWLYNNAEVSTNKEEDVYQKNATTKNGITKRKLKFNGVKKNYKGVYTCSAITFDQKKFKPPRSFSLIVDEKPLSTTEKKSNLEGEDDFLDDPELSIEDNEIPDNNVYLKVNQSLKVVCEGETDNIEWRAPPFDWKIVENPYPTFPSVERIKRKKVALKIKSATINDEGKYTCVVSKNTANKKKSFKLNVIDPVRIIDFPHNSTSLEGDNVTLRCVTSGHPKAMVNWIFNKKLPNGSTRPELLIDRTNSRYKFDGDALIISNITRKEAGRYMCEAKQDIKNGAADMKTVDVIIQEDDTLNDPKLTINDREISGNIYSRVNESLEVVCKGDAEVIEWRAPSKDVTLTDVATAKRTEKKKTALKIKIKSIAVENEGTYTCELSKSSTIKSKSFKLLVIDPIHITDLPQNLIRREGSNVVLLCVTSGHPKAIVTWRFNEIRQDGSMHSKPIFARSNSRYKFNDDALIIKNITYQEAGRYICEAKQHIERGTSDMKPIADIIVEHKPYPTQTFIAFEKPLNVRTEIACKMIANPAANYTWYRKINGVYQNISLSSVDSVLKVYMTNSSQYGEYRCTAKNHLGYNDQYISLNPMEFLQPANIEFIKVTESVVYFKAVLRNNSYLTSYIVEYKKKGDSNWTNRTIIAKTTSKINYNLDNLAEYTDYILRVRSVKRSTISEPSNEIEFTTKEYPRPPKIELKNVTDDWAIFKAKVDSNRTLTSYKVEYRRKNDKNWKGANFNIRKGYTWDSEYKMTNLAPKTTYILRVRSVNGLGISAPSREIEFTTKESLKPPRISIFQLTNDAARLKVITERDRTSTLTAYKVEYKKKGARKWIKRHFKIPKGVTSNHKYRLTHLAENTTYVLKMRSVNNFGVISGPSEELKFTTLPHFG